MVAFIAQGDTAAVVDLFCRLIAGIPTYASMAVRFATDMPIAASPVRWPVPEIVGMVSATKAFSSLRKAKRTMRKTYRMRYHVRVDVFDQVERVHNLGGVIRRSRGCVQWNSR